MPELLDGAPAYPLVRGYLHIPETPRRAALVLAHGAGGNAQAPLLVAVAATFAAAGITVLRCDLPFRQQHGGPPRPGDAARDREALRQAPSALRSMGFSPAFLGGHSYGGRQATILAAEDPSVAQALLLLSYPLHPPKRPGELRTAHLPRLRTPALFVQGTRDPFGSPVELSEAIGLIPAPTRLILVDNSGHDLRKLSSAALVDEFLAFTAELPA